jgi:hypothetical protein
MLRVVRPEAGEEPVRVLRLAVLMVVHYFRFYDRWPVENNKTLGYFPGAAPPHTLILSINIQNITKVS